MSEDEVNKSATAVALVTPTPPLVKGAWVYSYSEEENNTTYSRALLDETALAEVKKREFLHIGQVRDLVDRNSIKENQDIRGEQYNLDGEIMHIIDIQVNYPVFVTDDNIYTREELVKRYPFEGLRTTPETVFAQQEIAVFPPSRPGAEHEYVTHDVGSKEPFMRVGDLVKRSIYGDKHPISTPDRVVCTKIFVGKTKWKTFLDAQRFFNVVNDFVAPALTAGPATSTLSILDLAGKIAGMTMGGNNLLENGGAKKKPAET